MATLKKKKGTTHVHSDHLEEPGAVAAGKEERQIPFNLTLQWLESTPSSKWPTHERALLKVISDFCIVKVVMGADAIVDALEKTGLLVLSRTSEPPQDGEEDKSKVGVVVRLEHLPEIRSALGVGASHVMSASSEAVVLRVLDLLERLGNGGAGQLPKTLDALEALITPQCEVTFNIPPRDVLDDLEINDFLDIDEKSDAISYCGPKIMSFREPPVNKGFDWKAAVLVAVVFFSMAPNVLTMLGVW